MQYRKLGRSGKEASIIGFGCMRFPLLDQSNNKADVFDPSKPIDEEQTINMIHYALDHGVNYFDTAYPYHGGASEALLGKALDGKRNEVMIATKLPIWITEKAADFDKILDEQLNKLRTDYVDFYLLHGLNRPFWQKAKDLGALDFLDRVMADGRVRQVGFSFHDDVKIFKEIVDSYPWSMCQIQYNYFDENYQAGKEGLEYAASKGLGVVIMEPLRGGKLAEGIPEEVKALWDSFPVKRTPAEWALRWVWNHPQVSIVLSGMSSMEQLKENVSIASAANVESLTPDELDLISRVNHTYKKMLKIDCTGCAYCMPCPNGVNLPLNFSLYNDTFMFKDHELAIMIYNNFLSPEQRASSCAECAECEEHCPQQIQVREELKKVHERLSQST